MIPDKSAIRIGLALTKTLDSKPQLLPYLKVQILREFRLNLDRITDQEIDTYLEKLGNETKETR